MSHWNTGIGRGGNCSGHPGNDLEFNPGRGQRFRFFSSSPQDKRIASLQPHNHVASVGSFNQEPIDGLLLRIFPFAPPSDIDPLSLVLGMGKEDGISQIIVENHVCLLKTLFSSKGQEPRISRASSDQIDLPFVSSYHVHADP
jgi:hypothetical protein